MEYYINQINSLKNEIRKIKNVSDHCNHKRYTQKDYDKKFGLDCNEFINNDMPENTTLNEIKTNLLKLSRIKLLSYKGPLYSMGDPFIELELTKEINKCAQILYNEIINLDGEKLNSELMNRNYYLEDENRKLKNKLKEIKSINLDI